MSKMCPKCKREIDENIKFCPFCAAFTGDKNDEKKKSRIGVIVGSIAGAAVICGAAVAAPQRKPSGNAFLLTSYPPCLL